MFGFFSRLQKHSPAVTSVAMTECGPNRERNEDYLHASDLQLVYCVADGVGGGCEGEKASRIVCREVKMMMNAVAPRYASRVTAAQRSLVDANTAINEYAVSRNYSQMGSTAALLVFDPDGVRRATVIHVGDSRVYRIRAGQASALTRDHSVGNELGDFAGSRAEAFRARENPLTHVLTRAIGTRVPMQPDVQEVEVRPGDRYLLCTDGVHDVISDARLAVFAGGGTLESARARLSAEVLKAGAPDNYTFILVEVR